MFGFFSSAIGFSENQGDGKTVKIFDWDKAAHIIGKGNTIEAVAGLKEDLEYTQGTIYYADSGIPEEADAEYCMYLASRWATPILQVTTSEFGCVEHDCFVVVSYEEEDEYKWDADTYWPESAVAILKSYNKE